MNTPTLVAIHYRQIANRSFRHGEEIEPGLLEGELRDWWLDKKWCIEVPARRSLYRLFMHCSGSKEREPLSKNELALFGLET